jgi:hypothetical protein
MPSLLFVVFLCIASLVDPATVRGQAPPPVSPVLVLVHGRGQEGRKPSDVRRLFVDAFVAGERTVAGSEIVPAADIAFVWYADLIDPNAEAPDRTMGCSFAVEQTARSKAALDDWRQRLIGVLAAAGMQQPIMQRFMADTYKYLAEPDVRCEVDARLELEIGENGLRGRPLVVVAHSMGGIVTLSSLAENAGVIDPADRLRVVRLVTIGTQVGLPLVLEGLFGNLVTPPVPEPITIASWTNFMNEGDKLAFPTTGSFKASDAARLPRDVRIDVPGDRHAATSYLSDPRVMRSALWAWCRAYPAGSQKPAGCAKVEGAGDP